jgi:hypothetical protein
MSRLLISKWLLFLSKIWRKTSDDVLIEITLAKFELSKNNPDLTNPTLKSYNETIFYQIVTYEFTRIKKMYCRNIFIVYL